MYRRILVVVDRSPQSRAAIREGIAIAKAQRAELVFFHSLPRFVPSDNADVPRASALSAREFELVARDHARSLLSAAVERARGAGLAAVAIFSCGDPARCIATSAELHRCDLVVAGMQPGHALSRLLGGEIVPGLVGDMPSPVLVIKPRRLVATADGQWNPPVRRVMVLLDDEDSTGSAVRDGAALASAHGAQVLLVSVAGGLADEARRLADARQIVLSQCPGAQAVTVSNEKDLLTLAEGISCDIVVVPNSSAGALARLLSGSIVRRLVTEASVPVLVCRRPDVAPAA